MFTRRTIDTSRLRVTSKIALKLSCLDVCENDIKAADELYNYIAQGLDLPDTDPPTPSRLEQIKRGADDIISWIGSHKDDLWEGCAVSAGLIAFHASAEVPPPVPNLEKP